MVFLWVLLLVVIGMGVYLMKQYNQAQGYAQGVKEAHSNITVTLKKRLDLVNKLIDIARSYGEHEKLTHIAVVEGESLAQLSQASARADSAVTQLNSMARSYPDLKANSTYIRLMEDLARIENDVEQRRESCNARVRYYNTFCNSVPFVFFAPSLGFKPAPYFSVESADSLDNLKDFVTDDGAILRGKLAGAGNQVLSSTKALGETIESKSRMLIERGQEELQKRRNQSYAAESAPTKATDEPSSPSDAT